MGGCRGLQGGADRVSSLATRRVPSRKGQETRARTPPLPIPPPPPQEKGRHHVKIRPETKLLRKGAAEPKVLWWATV